MIQEFRRAPRRQAGGTIMVTDAMTGHVVGRIGNLSETGMLLIASEHLVEDALYQFRFTLQGTDGHDCALEIGAHLLWHDQAHAPGQVWAGFRFIAMSADQATRLRRWVEAPDSSYA